MKTKTRTAGAKAFAAILAALALLLSVSGCRTVPPAGQVPPKSRSYRINGQWYHPITDATGFRQTGIASWYGAPFHGRRTASGETYDMNAKTAAHKILPIGTFVLVRNLENGRETVVRINDRGPFVRGRIIDLSYRAAREIGMIGPGTASVEVIAMEKGPPGAAGIQTAPPDFYSGDFTVQVGAFTHRPLAEKLRHELLRYHEHVTVTPVVRGAKTFYRVRVGRFTSLEKAEEIETRLIETGYKNAFAVARDGG